MVLVRHALRDLPGPRHTPPWHHCGAAIQLPLVVRINHSSWHSNPLFFLSIQRHEEPKGAGWPLNFQFSGITVASPGGSISPFGTKVSRLWDLEHKVMGAGSTHFASGSVGVIVSGATPISIPWFLAVGEIARAGHWHRAYITFWRTLPSPCKVLPPS